MNDQLQTISSSFDLAMAQRDDVIKNLKKRFNDKKMEAEEKDRVERLKKSQLQSIISAIEEKLTEKDSTIESLRLVLRETENKCEEKNSRLLQLNAKIVEMSVKIVGLTKHLREVDAWKAKTSCRNNKLEDKIQSITMERNDSKSRAEDLKREVEKLQKELQYAHTELEQMKSECLKEVRNSATMEGQYVLEKIKNAELRKKLCDLQGNIRVMCRVRPLSDPNQYAKLKYIEEDKIIVGAHDFEFDKVFAPDSSQERVFKEIEDAVLTCMNGHRVSILAYGQTSR